MVTKVKKCPIPVKGFCVSKYERKGKPVKGYCVKPHTRKCIGTTAAPKVVVHKSTMSRRSSIEGMPIDVTRERGGTSHYTYAAEKSAVGRYMLPKGSPKNIGKSLTTMKKVGDKVVIERRKYPVAGIKRATKPWERPRKSNPFEGF